MASESLLFLCGSHRPGVGARAAPSDEAVLISFLPGCLLLPGDMGPLRVYKIYYVSTSTRILDIPPRLPKPGGALRKGVPSGLEQWLTPVC